MLHINLLYYKYYVKPLNNLNINKSIFYRLQILNINKNKFKSFLCFYPTVSEPTNSNNSSRASTSYGILGNKKYDGFRKLEELSFTFNKIDNLEALMGIVWLPKLKRIYLEGNPVIRKFHFKTTHKQEGIIIVH